MNGFVYIWAANFSQFAKWVFQQIELLFVHFWKTNRFEEPGKKWPISDYDYAA